MQQFLSDPGEQKIPVSSGKIPSAHASGEKDITAKESPGGAVVQAEASRTVTGNFHHFKSASQHGNGFSFQNAMVCSDGRNLKIDAESFQEISVGKHLFGDGMYGDSTTVLPYDFGGVPHMVVVAVCQKKEADGSFAESRGGTFRGIDEKVPFGAGNKIGIRFEYPSGERFQCLGCLI